MIVDVAVDGVAIVATVAVDAVDGIADYFC